MSNIQLSNAKLRTLGVENARNEVMKILRVLRLNMSIAKTTDAEATAINILISDFILSHFTHLTISDIKDAFELYMLDKYENKKEHYGRLTTEFVAWVLKSYIAYKNQREVEKEFYNGIKKEPVKQLEEKKEPVTWVKYDYLIVELLKNEHYVLDRFEELAIVKRFEEIGIKSEEVEIEESDYKKALVSLRNGIGTRISTYKYNYAANNVKESEEVKEELRIIVRQKYIRKVIKDIKNGVYTNLGY